MNSNFDNFETNNKNSAEAEEELDAVKSTAEECQNQEKAEEGTTQESTVEETAVEEITAEELPILSTVDEPVAAFDRRAEKKNLLILGFGLAIFTAVSLLVSLIIQFIAIQINSEIYTSIWFINLLSPLALYVFALPILLLIFSNVKSAPPEKKNFGFGKWCLYFLVCFGLMHIGAYIGNTVMSYLSMLTGFDYSNSLNSLIDFNNLNNLWITALFTVVVAPIGEEFIFRKLIIDRTRKYGGFFCVILSALIFGLMHGNFYQFFYAFALGLVLGYMYYSTGKLHLTVAIHAAVNFFGSIVPILLTSRLGSLDTTDIDALIAFATENIVSILLLLLFSLFSWSCMLCAVVLPIVFRKKIVLEKGECHIPNTEIRPTVFANAGIIVMLVVYLSQFILNLLPF